MNKDDKRSEDAYKNAVWIVAIGGSLLLMVAFVVEILTRVSWG